MQLPSSLACLQLVSLLGSAHGASITSRIKRDVLESVINPLIPVVQAVLSGDGLVQGVLGVLNGVLGVEQAYDYVVVGGGTSGNAIGYRLAEAGFSVAIVEAGIFYEIAKPVLGTTPFGDAFGIGSSPLDSIPTVEVRTGLRYDFEYCSSPREIVASVA
jgi:choline dehydrogenase